MAELKNAQKNVCIAVAWINFDIYNPIFLELLLRGVDVQIIINDDSNNARYKQQMDSLVLSGAEITLVSTIGIMHHKFCVIDAQRCMFGSYNWTINAAFRNIEDLNICDEPQLVYNYLQEFLALKELSKTDLNLLRNPKVCKKCGLPIMNILIVEPEGYYQTKAQVLKNCGCESYWYAPEYYDISVYNNYTGIFEGYAEELEYCSQFNNERCLEEIRAEMDFNISRYWSNVRRNRFGVAIIHAVGVFASRMYGRHNEEHFYRIIWKERGMEKYIPDEIPMDQ